MLRIADGDRCTNYADIVSLSCFDIEMHDTYGDGWATFSGTNTAQIDVYEDAVLVASYYNQDLDGMANSSTGIETQTETHCLDSATTSVDFLSGMILHPQTTTKLVEFTPSLMQMVT